MVLSRTERLPYSDHPQPSRDCHALTILNCPKTAVFWLSWTLLRWQCSPALGQDGWREFEFRSFNKPAALNSLQLSLCQNDLWFCI
jgi:hypothetical protein